MYPQVNFIPNYAQPQVMFQPQIPVQAPVQMPYVQQNLQKVDASLIQAYNKQIQGLQQMDELDRHFAEGIKLSNGSNILVPITKDDCMYKITPTNQQGLLNIKRVHVDYRQDKTNPSETTIYETNVPERALIDFLQGMRTIKKVDTNHFELDTVTGKQILKKEECQQFIDDNHLYLPKA